MVTNASRFERQVLLLYAGTDALLFYSALSLVSLARLDTLHRFDFVLLQRDRAICTILFVLAAIFAGCYKSSRITDRFDGVYSTIVSLAAAGIAMLTLTALLPSGIRVVSRLDLAMALGLSAVIIPAWRFWATGFISRLEPLHRFFYILGSQTEGKRLEAVIAEDSTTEALYVTLEEFKRRQDERVEHSRNDANPREDVIISYGSDPQEDLVKLLEYCEGHCRRCFLHPSIDDTLFLSQSKLVAIAGIPLLEVGNLQSAPYSYLKRLIDFVVALLVLVAVSPLCLLTAIAVKLTSSGPVIYSQERLGRYGRKFSIYKFRSMIVDAEKKTGPVWAKAKDTRVTPVGRFIRRHRIDEIPQLLNVLKGDMSLVGPRPERPHFHEEFGKILPLFDKRLVVRPGVSSLSHVLGSYSSEPGDRLRYDLIYISSMSFFTDLKILVATVRVVLGARGAH